MENRITAPVIGAAFQQHHKFHSESPRNFASEMKCGFQIPDVLFTLKRILHLEMAGNEIGVPSLHSLSCMHAQKIDLRRNALTRYV